MSPRFQPDLSKARAGFPIHEPGDYEVKVTKVAPIGYVREDDDREVAGATVSIEIVGLILNDGTLDRDLEGEVVSPVRLYVHTEGSWGITKRFIMAALGFTLEQEPDFNDEVATDLDIGVDFEPDDEEAATLGSGWNRLVGQHLIVSLSRRKYEGRSQQDVAGFLPVGVAA